MITIYRNETGETITSAPGDFLAAVTPWFEGADTDTHAELAECAALIATGDLNPSWASAVLGLWIA